MSASKPIIVLLILFLSCQLAEITHPLVAQDPQFPESVLATIHHATSDQTGSKPFTFDDSAYKQDLRDLPIGVFDSGIGGLTVLEAILALDSFNNQTLEPKLDGRPDFEDEKFIYLGDQANMPYGNYAAVNKQDYLRELILKDVIFLLGKRNWKDRDSLQPRMDKPPVKAIAIGCNTATAYGLDDIKQAIKAWNIPVFVVGVVEAGARGVLELPKESVQANTCVAVLATVGTCNSGAYPKSIRSTLGLAGRQLPSIVQQGFVELAAAIEGDPQVVAKGSAVDFLRRDIRRLLEEHRNSGDTRPISSVVLGCTHFPLVEAEIVSELQQLRNLKEDGKLVNRDLICDKIEVVNPAQLTAKELFRTLASARLRSTASNRDPNSKVRFFISVPDPTSPGIQLSAEGGLDYDYKYGRQTQQFAVEDTKVVPMTTDLLPTTSVNLMKQRLPHVWSSFSRASARP